MLQQFDYTKLRGRIREKYETLEDLARNIGILPITLTAKLDNADNFTQSEIDKMRDSLGIQGGEVIEFFFQKN
jgi:DNA-binding Xre family transcriptional regulator